MTVEDGVVDVVDESRGRFVVRFVSGSCAVFELLRQPGQEAASVRLAVGDTVRAAPGGVGKLVMLNMTRKLPLLVSGITGAADRDHCLRAMGD
ncbi:hypothetical protein UC34_15930 [Pandoraea vervacti]|uniref:Uncharacterized protein n=1 Tax=Pandoraea vervacti TaxID=656178 RepID=A0ABM5SZU6_9BURK|nr:hypothetical protein [Pandoraea vervacti]AJP58054.1 hypothetical protein UC34_15930 [Pandoraea vervacti]